MSTLQGVSSTLTTPPCLIKFECKGECEMAEVNPEVQEFMKSSTCNRFHKRYSAIQFRTSLGSNS